MDPIVLLLIVQLLLVVAVLLTTSSSKLASPVIIVVSVVKNWLSIVKESSSTDDNIELGGNEVIEVPQTQEENDGIIVRASNDTHMSKNSSRGNATTTDINQLGSCDLKINELGLADNPNQSNSYNRKHKKPISNNFRKYVKRLLSAATLKRTIYSIVNQSLTIFCISQSSSCHSNIVTQPPKMQQPKLFESSYLLKIIAARKAEKKLRIKVARLNMVIMKYRGARPMQVIHEAVEQDA